MKTAALSISKKSAAQMLANAILWAGAMIACAITLKGAPQAGAVNSILASLGGFSLLVNYSAHAKGKKKLVRDREVTI